MGWIANEVIGEVERYERHWMLLVLLGPSGEATKRMIEAVKGFLERMCDRYCLCRFFLRFIARVPVKVRPDS